MDEKKPRRKRTAFEKRFNLKPGRKREKLTDEEREWLDIKRSEYELALRKGKLRMKTCKTKFGA